MLPQGASVVKAQFIDALSNLAAILLSGLYFPGSVRRAHAAPHGKTAMSGIHSPRLPLMRDLGDKKALLLRTARKY
jgi:hypothetical protein